ncbi:MAG: SCO family protein [Anaerolineae bacterium]
MKSRALLVFVAAVAVIVAGMVASPALAQGPKDAGINKPATFKPPILDNVGFDQKLGQKIPLDLTFRDEAWRNVKLSDYFSEGKPVILVLAYYHCKNLCPAVIDELHGKLLEVPLVPNKDYTVLTVSIDPRETPRDAMDSRKVFMMRSARQELDEALHFLTGDQASIDALADAVGFRYAYDEANQEYAHPAGVMVLTPDGTISRYLFGTAYNDQDLRLAVVDSSQGKVGSFTDRILLFCYHYDPAAGRYSSIALQAMRIGGAVTVLLLGGAVGILLIREKRRHPVVVDYTETAEDITEDNEA